MTSILISYAQAMEDIRLHYALADVPAEEGFYIDIGANDPEIDSVTKLFYDRGWHGINVDPSSEWVLKLRESRPRDVNLQTAVSDTVGEIIFYNDKNGGLGTTVREVAEVHRENSIELDPVQVSTTTLTRICEGQNVSRIHFLKIDVEGAELSVLKGMDLSLYRPWVMCIESHFPNRTDIQLYEEWDSILTTSGYIFAYTDLVNRYYVAKEHEHRAICLKTQDMFCVPVGIARELQQLRRNSQNYEQRLDAIRKIASL